ncbi:unnamed protein product [Rotaria socialis]|uniref:PC-esterase domain-containing protein 1A n=4 Tax=Rotaria socialis TaxID=392032 RepID=A0A820JJ64_9BILA|nr:unnamed protein product [Rotaria socialis]CAF3432719.1 unnamed protein product [Rotaria socialis]CAF3438263.1 unnamed protein product [Rotaria socialis]CAF3454061.1 unnamed protein product [Rotaria socialis]CAF4328057.1 unnamed protein product [Rotaria socialis]
MTSPLDTLTANDVRQLLNDKYVLILGDSVVRGLYKDLVKFSHVDDFLSDEELRVKGEKRFFGDRLINGGVQKGLTNGIDYEEVREHTSGGHRRTRYYFLTRCYSSYMKNVIFNDIKNQTIKPDIIIMNSCLWDISRYGVYSMRSYKRNVDSIMGSFRQMLPDALFLWLSALPVSNSSKGGVIVPSAEYVRPIIPGLIRDGNYYCSQICNIHSVLYVDIHKILSNMLHLRQADGIHWSAIGNRIINEIILNHIKAYYDGVENFKCLRLRAELGNKIKVYKQHMKNHSPHSKINYLDQNIFDDDDNGIDKIEKSLKVTNSNHSTTLKRKRTDEDYDGEETNQQRRKIVVKSTTVKTEEKVIAAEKSIYKVEIKQEKILDNQKSLLFNHEYCDTMYDNEFEGLHMPHFSSCDPEPSEDLQLLNQIIQMQHQQTTVNSLTIGIKPFENTFTPVPFVISNDAKAMNQEPEYIIVSPDDEDQSRMGVVPCLSTTTILPIYLLNHL